MKNSKQMFETFFKGIKNKIDVLIVHKDHPFSPNGIHSGAEMGTIHLARALVRVGYQVMVVGKITSGPGVYDDVFYYDLGETYNVQECFDDLKEYEIDLLISVTRADVIKLSLKYGNINKRAMWLQDSALEETRGTVEQINQTSDLIIYVSQVLRKHLESQGIDESLGTIIHNGFDNSIFYPRKNPFNKNKIIFAGALVPEKGINLLVDAFNIASLENKNIELWLYGSESLWGYKQFFDKKRISFNNPKIHFAGKVSQLQLAEAFSDSALAIIPSLSSKRLDPFPLISIEAQASGCPVIVTRCGGLPEGLIAGKTGYILEKEDPYDLSALILNFFGNIQLMESMRINAREHVKENFNWEYIAEQFVQAGRKAPKRTNIKIFSERKEEKKSFLFICQQIPCYDRAGGDFRTFRIMRQLALEGHKVKLIARDDLPDYYLEMSEVERNRYISNYEKYGIQIDFLNHLELDKEGKPISIKINSIGELLSNKKYDAVIITWWNIALEFMSPVRRFLPTAKLIVDSVDIAFLRLLRFAALQDLKDLWLEANFVKHRELDSYKNADIILTVTEDDKDVVLNELPNANVQVVSNVHPVCPCPNDYKKREDLLFVGYFKHKPNEDAAIYLVKDIFPIIKEKLPDVKLYLVGNAPTKEILELANDSVIITGYVEDLTPYWQNCRLSIAPLRYGAGFKGKVGQSMAEGLPVVTTSIGVEGMDLKIGREVLVSDDPFEFANLVIEAYTNEALWTELSKNGYKKVKDNWSDEIVIKKLIEACDTPLDKFDYCLKNIKVIEEVNYYSMISQGYYWLHTGMISSANEIFKKAIKDYPNLPNAYVGLGWVSILDNKYEEALNIVSQFSLHEFESSGYYTLIGLLNNHFNQYEDGYRNFLVAVDLFEKNSIAHFELGKYYYNNRNYSKSLLHFHSSIKYGNKDFNLLANVSKIFIKYGNIDESYKTLVTALSLCSNNNDLYHTNILLSDLDRLRHTKRIISSPAYRNSDNIKVSIIIPTYNKIEFTKKCISSIENSHLKREHFEIIIVDNNSTDSTRTYLEKHLSTTKYRYKTIFLDSNLGFAKANNIGVDSAIGEYFLLLNNDTEVLSGWLESLLEIMEKDYKVGAVSGKLLFSDKSTIQHAGIVITEDHIENDLLLPRLIYRGEKYDLASANNAKEYQALTAAFLLVRRNVFEAVGGFDEGYWNGYEDVDLCFKIRELGWKLVYQPKSIVIHHESQSGPERFSKVKENIKRLHSKWLGKIKPDVIIQKDGQIIETEFNQILDYKHDHNNSFTVSILCVTYNQLHYTKEFVDSIENFVKLPHELIIVDNGSNDETIEYLTVLSKRSKNITLLMNENNLGFPTAVNQGIKAAKGKYIIIANNDIVITKDSIENMVDAAESDPQVGLVGPISNEVSGLQKDGNAKYNSIEEMHMYAARIAEKNKGELINFPRIAFLCTLIKREVIDKIGGLDERFSPGNYEDDDFCLRAQLAGYKTVIAKDVFVHHYGSKSFKADGIEAYKKRLETNKQIFIDKWGVTPDELWLENKNIKEHTINYPINKNLFKQYFDRTQVHLKDNELELAKQSIQKAIEHFSENDSATIAFYELCNIAGNIHLAVNDVEKAKEYFEEELNSNPSSSSACKGLGDVFLIQENIEAAKTMYEWAVKNDPNNQGAVEALGSVNELLGYEVNHITVTE